MFRRLPGEDRSRRILRVGGFAEPKHGTIFFIPLDEILGNAGSPPDQHGQDSRCGRIKSAGMTDLHSAEKMPHLRHDIVGGPP